MAADPRHLRARWMIAAVGWLLWGISLVVPTPIAARRLWTIYPEAANGIWRHSFQVDSVRGVIQAAAILGFLLATGVMATSPLLIALNHSTQTSPRRWRWVGVGLLAMAQLSVMMIFRRESIAYWNVHLMVLAHVVVAIAILPWPREHAIIQSGFEVVIPDQPTAER